MCTKFAQKFHKRVVKFVSIRFILVNLVNVSETPCPLGRGSSPDPLRPAADSWQSAAHTSEISLDLEGKRGLHYIFNETFISLKNLRMSAMNARLTDFERRLGSHF